MSGSSSTMRIIGRGSGISSDRRFRGNGRRFLERKREPESRSARRYALRPRASTVQANNRPADGEPESDVGAATFDRSALELREYALQIAIGKAAAVVFHRHDDFRRLASCEQPHDG